MDLFLERIYNDPVLLLTLSLLILVVLRLMWTRWTFWSRVDELFEARWERECEAVRRLAFEDAEVSLLRREKEIRRDAVERSEAVHTGKYTEHLLPYFPDFPFDPRDARFVGSPIDLVIFDGISEGDVREVVFVEVKTGGGTLSLRERQVRDAVLEGRVDWLELRQ